MIVIALLAKPASSLHIKDASLCVLDKHISELLIIIKPNKIHKSNR